MLISATLPERETVEGSINESQCLKVVSYGTDMLTRHSTLIAKSKAHLATSKSKSA